MRKLLIKLYVPTTDKYIINNLAEEFSRLFGGATVIPNCKGYWKNPSTNKYEVDKITTIESYTELNLNLNQLLRLKLVCISLRRKLNQICVALVLNDKIHFI